MQITYDPQTKVMIKERVFKGEADQRFVHYVVKRHLDQADSYAGENSLASDLSYNSSDDIQTYNGKEKKIPVDIGNLPIASYDMGSSSLTTNGHNSLESDVILDLDHDHDYDRDSKSLKEKRPIDDVVWLIFNSKEKQFYKDDSDSSLSAILKIAPHAPKPSPTKSVKQKDTNTIDIFKKPKESEDKPSHLPSKSKHVKIKSKKSFFFKFFSRFKKRKPDRKNSTYKRISSQNVPKKPIESISQRVQNQPNNFMKLEVSQNSLLTDVSLQTISSKNSIKDDKEKVTDDDLDADDECKDKVGENGESKNNDDKKATNADENGNTCNDENKKNILTKKKSQKSIDSYESNKSKYKNKEKLEEKNKSTKAKNTINPQPTTIKPRNSIKEPLYETENVIQKTTFFMNKVTEDTKEANTSHSSMHSSSPSHDRYKNEAYESDLPTPHVQTFVMHHPTTDINSYHPNLFNIADPNERINFNRPCNKKIPIKLTISKTSSSNHNSFPHFRVLDLNH